jgi:hypothetical protein
LKKTFCGVLVFCMAAYGIFAQTAGVIRELTGNVELKTAGSPVFIAARAGDEIEMNTIVSTGFKSTAVIETGDTLITVRPLTRLTLAENLNVNLQAGRVKVDANPKAGTKANYTVQSSGATALVQGTSFEFDAHNIKMNEGTAVFRGISGPAAIVKTGGENFIGADGRPSESAVCSLMPSVPGGGRGGSGGGQQAAGGGGGSCCD